MLVAVEDVARLGTLGLVALLLLGLLLFGVLLGLAGLRDGIRDGASVTDDDGGGGSSKP